MLLWSKHVTHRRIAKYRRLNHHTTCASKRNKHVSIATVRSFSNPQNEEENVGYMVYIQFPIKLSESCHDQRTVQLHELAKLFVISYFMSFVGVLLAPPRRSISGKGRSPRIFLFARNYFKNQNDIRRIFHRPGNSNEAKARTNPHEYAQ